MSHNKLLIIGAGVALLCSILYATYVMRPVEPRSRPPVHDPVALAIERDRHEARAYDAEIRALDLARHGEVMRYGRSLVERYREPGDDRWIWPEDMPDIEPVLLQWDDVIGAPSANDTERHARRTILLILMNRILAAREQLPEDAFLEFIHATRSLPHP